MCAPVHAPHVGPSSETPLPPHRLSHCVHHTNGLPGRTSCVGPRRAAKRRCKPERGSALSSIRDAVAGSATQAASWPANVCREAGAASCLEACSLVAPLCRPHDHRRGMDHPKRHAVTSSPTQAGLELWASRSAVAHRTSTLRSDAARRLGAVRAHPPPCTLTPKLCPQLPGQSRDHRPERKRRAAPLPHRVATLRSPFEIVSWRSVALASS